MVVAQILQNGLKPCTFQQRLNGPAPSELKRNLPVFCPYASPHAHLRPPLLFSGEFLIFQRSLVLEQGPAANISEEAQKALHVYVLEL